MFWNEKFFEMPDGLIKSKMTAIKFGFVKNKINLVQPFLFVCNKTTPCDKTLVSNIFKGNFVFLKDEVIQSIYDGTFSKEDYAELIAAFNLLRDGLISVVIFPEKRLTIFGKTGYIPYEISNLIFDSNSFENSFKSHHKISTSTPCFFSCSSGRKTELCS